MTTLSVSRPYPSPRPMRDHTPSRPRPTRAANRERTRPGLGAIVASLVRRAVALANPRKTGRHRMWEKHHLQHLVRRDWVEVGKWS